jgi:hypothetical protein
MTGDQRRVNVDSHEGPQSSSPGIRLSVVVLGLIAILAVVLLTSGGGPSDVEAVAVTTTTTTPTSTPEVDNDPILRVGDPLRWRPAGRIDDAWPISIVEHQEMLYLFTTDSVEFGSPAGNGLDAWVSADGGTWEPQGKVIESPNLVQTVISTSRGLMAVGMNGGDGSPRVWMSSDAREWTELELPTEVSDEPVGSRTYLQTAWAGDDLLLVFGSTYIDLQQIVVDALPETLQSESGAYGYGMGWGGYPFQVTIQGPLGIVVFSATAEELGLTEEQIELLEGTAIETPVTVWSSSDGVAWARSELEANYVSAVTPDPSGDLLMIGYGPGGGEATWTSSDGIEWERQVSTDIPDTVVPWGGALIGTRNTGSHPDLVHSEDGVEWESFGVDQLLANDIAWYLDQTSAGEAGAAVIAHGYDSSVEGFGSEPVVLEKEGYTLTRDDVDGTLVLERDDVVVVQLTLYSGRVAEGVTIDFEARTITFLDPETNRPLVTFTFEEVAQAEMSAYGSPGAGERQILLFTRDGLEWSVQDMGDIVGRDRVIDTLLVDERGLIMATYVYPNVRAGPPPAPEVEMWVAPLDQDDGE